MRQAAGARPLPSARIAPRPAIVAMALALIALAGCGGSDPQPVIPPPEAEGPPAIGYNENFTAGAEGNELLAGSGATVVRKAINWTAAEAEPGEIDWQLTDRIYEELAGLGIRPLWVVTSAPCWAAAEKSCEPNLPSYAPAPDSFGDYAEFTAAVADRYPDSAGIEVWNEPNLERFYIGGGDAASYAELFKTTAEAVAEVDPAFPLLVAGLSPVLEEGETEDRYAWQPYLQTLIDAGIAASADGIGLHPYSAFEPGADFVENAAGQLADARRIVGSEPLYVTEVGLTTAGPNEVSARQQAQGLRQVYGIFSGAGVPLIVVHRFFDEAEPEFPAEAGYGVVGADLTPKPAYCAVAELAGAPCTDP